MSDVPKVQTKDDIEFEIMEFGGGRYLGKAEVDGSLVVFRMNNGFGPSEDEWDRVLCRISNISKCKAKIPPGTPDGESDALLDKCLDAACPGGGLAGGGGVVVFM